ncbi:hypothetical protein [Streptomyces sp. RKAG293]|uniref:hypothetical protein n=1 Tax=Streptomyces sp. RKAG293 TaxID=2893403 RepID=UPI0020334E97|nr:hypothetical protein [Streptomyces sp. RKAG293]MCM2419399.1 hypothetical protein [Streptomyces sp. RKAG293]
MFHSRHRRNLARWGAAVAAVTCALGMATTGTAQADAYPYALSDLQTHPGNACASGTPLPWIGNTRVALSARVDGTSPAEPRPSVHFKVWKGDENAPVAEAVLTSLAGGQASTFSVPDELLPSGEGYAWSARLENSAGPSSAWAAPCGFSVDRDRPPTPTVAFTDGYPNSGPGVPAGTVRSLRFTVPAGSEVDGFCFSVRAADEPDTSHPTGPHGCGPQWAPVGPDGTATATFVTPDSSGPSSVKVFSVDRAGQRSDTARVEYWITTPFVEPPGDYSGDGHPDLFSVGTDGKLYLHPGRANGTFGAPVLSDGGDWRGTLIARAGYNVPLSGLNQDTDPRNDLLVRRGSQLFVYPGNGKGGFGTPVPALSGVDTHDWSAATQLVVSPNPQFSGFLLAKEGDRLVYAPLGRDAVVGRVITLVQSGWADKTVAISDQLVDGDLPKVWVRDGVAGTLSQYPILRDWSSDQLDPGSLGDPTVIAASGWKTAQHPLFLAPFDLNGDGRNDLLATTRTQGLQLFVPAADGTLGAPATLARSGWPTGHNLF